MENRGFVIYFDYDGFENKGFVEEIKSRDEICTYQVEIDFEEYFVWNTESGGLIFGVIQIGLLMQ